MYAATVHFAFFACMCVCVRVHLRACECVHIHNTTHIVFIAIFANCICMYDLHMQCKHKINMHTARTVKLHDLQYEDTLNL